jgi:hypothetical protein
LEQSRVDGCRLRVNLQPPYDGTIDMDLLRQVRSGREYSSGHPAMQQINPLVVTLSLQYLRE